jgi:type I restriction enzyme R subunit
MSSWRQRGTRRVDAVESGDACRRHEGGRKKRLAASGREAEYHARDRESLEQRLKREAEERVIWERLAQDTEAEKSEIAARLHTLQAAAEQAPKAETLELISRGEAAASKIDIDEAETRALIDQQLQDSGWEADTETLRYAAGTRPAKGKNMAIAEWPDPGVSAAGVA